MGKALPFFVNPFPVDFWTNASFLDEEIEGTALFNSHHGENADVVPEGISGPGSWNLRSVRDPRFAPCLPWSLIYHQFRIAWLRSVVWMNRQTSQKTMTKIEVNQHSRILTPSVARPRQ